MIQTDHCIQQLRQYIMCAGDMTPLPTKYSPATQRNYVVADRKHTCRSFNQFHDWIVSRHEGTLEVPPYSREI